MASPVKPRRAYDSPRRREAARATRRALLSAARDLFIERGYVATTIDAIASRAELSPETVYSVFGTKRRLLSELVDVSIAGDDAAPPVLQQDWVEEMRRERDPHRRIRILARHGHSILEQRVPIDSVVQGAASADPEIAALEALGKVQRLNGQRELLRIVVGTGGLRQGIDFERATDILYALGSPETYRLLVTERGWTGAQFERWYGETLERLLLDPKNV